MKISIQIDGVEVASQSTPGTTGEQGGKPAEGNAAAAASSSGLTDVFARAAAMGAIDAGPAPGSGATPPPHGAPQPSPGAPQMYVGNARASAVTAHSGGAAPGFESTPPSP